MEEEEDRILLSSLGIKSAKAEEVERGILTEIGHEGEAKNEVGMSADASYDEDEGTRSMASQASIVGQLRAVEVEIKAVVACIGQAKVTEPDEGDEEGEGEKRIRNSFQLFHSGRELQHALATDQLKSLKRTKARLQKEQIS